MSQVCVLYNAYLVEFLRSNTWYMHKLTLDFRGDIPGYDLIHVCIMPAVQFLKCSATFLS